MTKDLKYPKEERFEDIIPYFKGFMMRYKESTFKMYRNKLIEFAIYLRDIRTVEVLNADYEDLLAYFKKIDKLEITRFSKNKYRWLLKNYYEYIKELKEKIEKTHFINPVPSTNLFDFREKELTIEDIEKEEDTLTYKIVDKVLNYLYATRKRIFIVILTELYSGARISEICEIKLKNIDFDERFFFTRVKSKKTAVKQRGVYFFPVFYIPYLKDWIKQLKTEFNNPIYLFQSKNSKDKVAPLSDNTIRKHMRHVKNELGLNCSLNPHAFRDFLNTMKFEKGMGDKFRTLLLNQTPKNVNVKHYLKKYQKRKELLKIYDKFFPFPEFVPKLNLI